MDRRGKIFALRSQLLAAAFFLSCVDVCFAGGIGGGGGSPSQTQIGTPQLINTADSYSPTAASQTLFPQICTCGFYGTDFTVPTSTQVLKLLGLPDGWVSQIQEKSNKEMVQAVLSTPEHPINHLPTYLQCDGCVSQVDEISRTHISGPLYYYVYKYTPNIRDSVPVYVGVTVNVETGRIVGPGRNSHLGMYVSEPSNLTVWGMDGGATGNGSVLRSGGYRLTDTAGVLAPGTRGPGFRDATAGSSVFATYDATLFLGLPANQSLLLTGFFNYQYNSASIASTPGAASHADSYASGGDVFWRVGSSYFDGSAAYGFGRAVAANQFDSGTGFNDHGYFVDARIGNMFPLWTIAGPPPPAAFPTKASPKPTIGGVVGLDLSAHVGYATSTLDGLTDSTGFVVGSGQAHQADVGVRARLLALIPSGGVLWMPYVGAKIDQVFDYSNTVSVPAQTSLTTGDLVSIQMAKTFAGAEFGVDARSPGGWTVGVKGFYVASADTNIVGGSVSIKIPFNYGPAAAPRY
jgi:hypothetical protein